MKTATVWQATKAGRVTAARTARRSALWRYLVARSWGLNLALTVVAVAAQVWALGFWDGRIVHVLLGAFIAGWWGWWMGYRFGRRRERGQRLRSEPLVGDQQFVQALTRLDRHN